MRLPQRRLTGTRERLSGAALRCTRERLGLTTRWLASHLDVTERSVHRWESGVRPVPDGVRVEVERLAARHGALVERLHARLDRMTEPRLFTWRTDADVAEAGEREMPLPASWHRAAVGLVLARRPGVEVVYRMPMRPNGGS
ncbi:helix-turn-helix domain-containing protein [Xylanimonas ulmi]|uniref:DNA-binding transcriptional regulator YiaG n=1 Tax=Xylanimonas ulmi TaxID=228973 RepID=A0A4Q7M745_9MICO|nr:helix-turn-helix domain-containing protein [Xylanibacterium ulmi]RZS62458.1 DNA-binding transcriptional regulator YiaG [Xylanibacterium ulmi]